jgi:hypothetical protein
MRQSVTPPAAGPPARRRAAGGRDTTGVKCLRHYAWHLAGGDDRSAMVAASSSGRRARVTEGPPSTWLERGPAAPPPDGQPLRRSHLTTCRPIGRTGRLGRTSSTGPRRAAGYRALIDEEVPLVATVAPRPPVTQPTPSA